MEHINKFPFKIIVLTAIYLVKHMKYTYRSSVVEKNLKQRLLDPTYFFLQRSYNSLNDRLK